MFEPYPKFFLVITIESKLYQQRRPLRQAGAKPNPADTLAGGCSAATAPRTSPSPKDHLLTTKSAKQETLSKRHDTISILQVWWSHYGEGTVEVLSLIKAASAGLALSFSLTGWSCCSKQLEWQLFSYSIWDLLNNKRLNLLNMGVKFTSRLINLIGYHWTCVSSVLLNHHLKDGLGHLSLQRW